MAFFFFCFFSFFKKAKAHCQKSLLRSPKSDPIRSFSWRRLSYMLFCPVWSQRRRRDSAPPYPVANCKGPFERTPASHPPGSARGSHLQLRNLINGVNPGLCADQV
jgi:hypothetical protein